MKKEKPRTWELVREYTTPGERGFKYYVLRFDNGKELTYGRTAYNEMKNKGKKMKKEGE